MGTFAIVCVVALGVLAAAALGFAVLVAASGPDEDVYVEGERNVWCRCPVDYGVDADGSCMHCGCSR